MAIHENEPTQGYRTEIGTPDEFTADLPGIEALLERRGHVPLRFLRENLPRAIVIAAVRHGKDVVAVCVLKGLNIQHNKTVSDRSGYPLAPNDPELGYAATDERHTRRGLGSRLNQEVLSRAGDMVYATVRICNEDEQRNLERCGFRRERNSWKGDGDYEVGLWVRDETPKKGPTL
jgi:RimJ/RimL family protein N-acetyltransferase